MAANKKDGISRIRRAAMAKALVDKGYTSAEAAKNLDISISYVRSLLTDPDGAKERARKENYRGVCIDCGGRTNYKYKTKRCQKCENARHHANRRWTRERILTDIRRWEDLYGEPPKASQWLLDVRADETGERPWPHVGVVQKEFGSWSNAIEAAGFKRRRGYERTAEWREKCGFWSKEKIIEAMQRWADEHGAAPTQYDWKKKGEGYPSPTTVVKYHGSWDAALDAAGLRRQYRSRVRYELMEFEPALLYPTNGSKSKVKVPTFAERGEGRRLLDVVEDLKRGR